MYIEDIGLRNFRCFQEQVISFHDQMTVLVAPNGGGKSTVLDALAYVVSAFVGEFDKNQRQKPSLEDIRVVRDKDGTRKRIHPSDIQAHFVADGFTPQHPSVRVLAGPVRPNMRNDPMVIHAGHLLGILHSERSSDEVALPVIAYYGSKRTVALEKYEVGWELGNAALMRPDGYAGGLTASAGVSLFRTWYGKAAIAGLGVQMKQSRGEPVAPSEERLAERARAVKETVNGILGGAFERQRYRLDLFLSMNQVGVLDTEQNVELGLHQLSDGFQCMISMVGDLAVRCAVLNPHLGAGAPAKTPGVVLIDEVDLHLHPAWQQRVLGDLQRAFPLVQFIVTTHSPQVLSTVPKECVRIIHQVGYQPDGCQWVVEEPEFQTRGVDSTDVLAKIMGVDPVPKVEEAQWLADYRALIENDQLGTPGAAELRSKLVAHFGERHPLILDCDRLIRFQAFKQRRSDSGRE